MPPRRAKVGSVQRDEQAGKDRAGGYGGCEPDDGATAGAPT